MTGAQAAEQMLHSAGIYDVRIERVEGFLSDHYDPSSRTLRLSPGVYDSDSLSAIGVACHEAGHALQDAASYGPLGLRSALVPVTNISSWLSYIVILVGFIFQSGGMVMLYSQPGGEGEKVHFRPFVRGLEILISPFQFQIPSLRNPWVFPAALPTSLSPPHFNLFCMLIYCP